MVRYVSKQQALDSEFRRVLLSHVDRRPGASLSDLAERFGVSPSTILWHTQKLQAADLLGTERQGQRRLFYSRAQGRPARQEGRRRDALRDDLAARIWSAVRQQPGVSVRSLTELLGAGASAVRRQTARLVHAGLLSKQRVGASLGFYPTTPGA